MGFSNRADLRKEFLEADKRERELIEAKERERELIEADEREREDVEPVFGSVSKEVLLFKAGMM